MKFYNENYPLYLETDTLGVDLEAGLLQIRNRINCPKEAAIDHSIQLYITFASRSPSSAKTHYSNIEGKHLAFYMDERNSTTTVL